MSQKASPTLVGAFVLAAVALGTVSIALVGSGKLFAKTHPFILFFEDNVNGLRTGAPVKFQGVEIGSVTSIRLRFTQAGATTIVPVTIALDEKRIESISGTDITFESGRIQQIIDQGLRARLDIDSLLTGQRYVALDLVPESPAKLLGAPDGMDEIPTIPTTFEEVTSAMSRALERFKEMKIEEMVADLVQTSRALRELVTSPQMQEAPANFVRTLEGIDRLVSLLSEEIEPFAPKLSDATESVQDAANQVEATLRSLGPTIESLHETLRRTQEVESELILTLEAARSLISPNAPLIVQLQSTLQEFGAAARSLRALAELVERNPGALLRGRDTTSNP